MSEGPSEHIVDQGLGLMPANDDQQITPEVTQQDDSQDSKINPAWSELLSQVPAGLHNVLTPHLQKWDQNYQQGLQKVHSQYEPYKPFIDDGIDPESLNNAMLIMQNLEQDPERFARALVEHYGLNLGEQGQVEADQEESVEGLPFDITSHPDFQKVQQVTELLAQQTLAQHQAAEEAAAESELDQMIAAAKEKHGEFDEEYVYQKMYSTGCDVETAVQAFIDKRNQWVQNYQPPGANAPRLMGSGGGLPSQATPARNMTPKQRRALMVQTLQNLKASGG